ncbi:MAG TPA: MlaD family protein [Solirubrobacteraceae bacterium]|nr:MlaD family protein [Solirubrobacteraceae bacterium]
MGRRRSSSIAGSPLLIGAVTTLIVVVAVYLSYNANNGLPFVPTYDIKVELPSASGLSDQNQVRLGGTRVGTISSLSPHLNPNTGRSTAIASLKLEKKVEPLPANTTAEVLSVSTIGLKYLELKRGDSKATIKAGSTIPISQTKEPVNIEELFNMFDKPTRTAIKVNSNQFGNGIAARGRGLNTVIEELRPLVTNAVPVLHNLGSPQTGLHEFFVALNRASEEAAPVAQEQANYYVYLDKFFTDWASVAKSIEEANTGGPPSLEQAIYSLPHQAKFYENATEFMDLLRPSAKSLVKVAPELGHAFSIGTTNLAAATQLNNALLESSKALDEFANNPIAQVGLEEFTNTLETANPLLAGISPSQGFCNYWTLAFRNVASLESENIGIGTLARAGFVLSPTGVNNEGYPSSAPANGPSEERHAITHVIEDTHNNHLHANMYPNTAGPGQPQVCEAGNETYIPAQTTIGNLPAADVTKNREFTTREQNLYGEKYPTSTLEALGLAKPKGKKK